jgi:nucleoside 2-deoxyribosyltransferase
VIVSLLQRSRDSVLSAVGSLKEILSIITALTLTNTLVLLVTGGSYSNIANLAHLKVANAIYSLLLITTLIRFYHGNVRHLDTAYSPHGVHFGSPLVTMPPGGLGIDFTVIFGQSILLAVASFYAAPRLEFILLLSMLLAIDALWSIFVQRQIGDKQGFAHQRRWLLNNIAALIALLFIFIYSGQQTVPDNRQYLLHLAALILGLNTIIDFFISWSFYFPGTISSARGEKRKVFLAAPFTQTIDERTHLVDPEYRKDLEQLIRHLESHGDAVFSSHMREKWGDQLDDPVEAIEADVREIQQSDIVVALLGDPLSPGVQMELGVALVHHKRILVLVKRGQFVPYLVRAFRSLPHTQIIEFNSIEEAMTMLTGELDQMVLSHH